MRRPDDSAIVAEDAAVERQTTRRELPEIFGIRRFYARLANPEILGELVLLAFIGAFFVLMLWESREWRLAAALMPRIAIAIGTPFWVIRVVTLLRHVSGRSHRSYAGVRGAQDSAGQIMDLGFYTDYEGAFRRFVIVTGSIIGLGIGVWMVGWHVTAPIYMFLYLFFLGKLRWWGAALGGLFILAAIVILYDLLFATYWNEPVLFQLVKSLLGRD